MSRYQFPDIYRGNVSEICLGLDKYRKENEREYLYWTFRYKNFIRAC